MLASTWAGPTTLTKLTAIAMRYICGMCRNIRVLLNFEPPTTEDEIAAAALQYVRKVSGTRKPPRANLAAFEQAVQAITEATRKLLASFEVHGPPRSREAELQKARVRNAKRFGAKVAAG